MTRSPTHSAAVGRRLVLAASTGILAPSIVRSASDRVLKFAPESDLSVLDPIWTTTGTTQHHAYLVYDMLFALNSKYEVQPQMAEGAITEGDGHIWRISLRDGLRFHDGEPVLARDCVASIRRWGARDPFGQTLLAATDELRALDDRTLQFRLKRPFALLPAALGKPVSTLCVIMPERLALTDPYSQVSEVIGSGPFRFLGNERVPGARVAYARFADYRPRANGVADWTSGPKIAHFDRVEWTIISDPATAAGALRNGEVDWLETPQVDLIPALRRRPNLAVEITNTAGRLGFLRMNHLHPPFDKVEVRRALLAAVNQADFMNAVSGTDPMLSRTGVGFFTPGGPSATDAGLDIWSRTPSLSASRQAIAAAGYVGETIVVLGPGDTPALRAISDVGVDLMQKLGMRVDYQVVDWGTVVARRAKKDPPQQGGWNVFPGYWTGLDAVNPAAYPPLRGNGDQAWFGWPTVPGLERLRDQWLEAPDADAARRVTGEMQRVAFEDVPFIPVGQYFYATAYSRSLQGILPGSTLFWNVRRV